MSFLIWFRFKLKTVVIYISNYKIKCLVDLIFTDWLLRQGVGL